MKNKFFENYCSGCGICAEKCGVEFYEKEGFMWPKITTRKQRDFCKTICPATLRNFNNDQNVKLWGNHIEIFSGWSCDDTIRHQAASGGGAYWIMPISFR